MSDAADQLLDAMNKNDDLMQQAHDVAQAADDHGDEGGDRDGGGELNAKDEAALGQSDRRIMALRELLRRRADLIDRARKQ